MRFMYDSEEEYSKKQEASSGKKSKFFFPQVRALLHYAKNQSDIIYLTVWFSKSGLVVPRNKDGLVGCRFCLKFRFQT